MRSDELPKINIADLKVGDKVYLARETMLGWRSFRYNTYHECTVVRITPKKTKVYLSDGASEIEMNPAKTCFYKYSPELHEQNQVAACASECNMLVFRIDSKKDCLQKLTDDEFLELHGYLSSALTLLEQASQR